MHLATLPRVRSAVLVLGLFAVLTVAMTWPQARDLRAVPDPGDPLFSTWRLAWIAHQLPRDPLHLFDANAFYPERATLAYSDGVLLPALVSAPLFWLGAHPLTVYNLLFLSAFALSGAAMFAFVWSETRSMAAGAVAGCIFGFYPYRFEHYSHFELQMAMWLPLALLALHRVIRASRVRDGVLLGLIVAAQTWSCIYYGVFLVTFLVPVWAVLAVGWRRRPAVRPLAAAVLVAGGLVLPLAPPYLHNRAAVGERTVGEVRFYSATPGSYLAAHPTSAVYGELLERGGGPERQLFPGIVPIVLTVVALWPPLSAVRIAYAVGLALAWELSLGLNGFLYPLLYRFLPVYHGLRAPARFSIFVGLALAALAGLAVARIVTWFGSRRAGPAVAATLAAVVLFEYHPALALAPPPAPDRQVYALFAGGPPVVLLELPLAGKGWGDDARQPGAVGDDAPYLYFSIWHWQKLLNGSSGFFPRSYMDLTRKMRNFPDDSSVAYLRSRGVDYLVLHGRFYDPSVFEDICLRLQSRADLQPIVPFTGNRAATLVYRLAR